MAFFEFPHTRTYDSDLGWLIRQCKTNQDAIDALETWANSTDHIIDELNDLVENVKAGNLPPDVANGIKTWISANFNNIIAEMIKSVWFGLTDSGYYCVYIPQSWKDVVFKTSELDYFSDLVPEYGHLILITNYN